MLNRESYQRILTKKLCNNPAVVLLGPRQVGKTTLSKSVQLDKPFRYFDLESPNTLSALRIDTETFLASSKEELIILDEVQVYPAIFAILRSVIDQYRTNGRFLLLGSANPSLIKGVSESLAGRVSHLELAPLDLLEVGVENQEHHWYRGGFPQAYLSQEDTIFIDWVQDYIRAYAERDVNLIFNVNLNSSLIRRLWVMLAHLNGGLLNTANLSRSLGVSATTINHYIDILEAAFLIKRIHPWYVNTGKRLVKSPKIYLNDTGILHGLMKIKSYTDLMLHPIIGASWENYVIQQISSVLKGKLDLYFYRTHNGSEVDLVLVDGITPLASIEIKNANNPSVSKGFYISIDDLKTSNNYVITRNQTYYKANDISIISLSDFLTVEIPKLIK